MKKVLAVLLCITILLPCISGVTLAAEEESFAVMRARWAEQLTGNSGYDPENEYLVANINELTNTAQGYWDSMYKGSDITNCLWKGVTFGNDPARIQTTYTRLGYMALAYASKGSDLYHNQDMLEDILYGLQWMNDSKIYADGKSSYQNWWQWQIGVPLELHNICVLLYDVMSDSLRNKILAATEYYQPDVTMSGANRAWESEVIIGRGIIEGNVDTIAIGVAGLDGVLGMTASGDGFYDDGSFVQHNFYSYTGGYGRSLLISLSDIFYLTDGTKYEITSALKNNVYTWIKDAYAPLFYKGAFMDMARGREMSREASQTELAGHTIIAAMLRIAENAPSRQKGEIRSMAKYWIQSGGAADYYGDVSASEIITAQALMSDNAVTAMSAPVFYKQFNNMDRAVQATENYTVALSMHSSRIGNYESINSENQKAYHTADGMLYLYNNDDDAYQDAYWPTANMYRLPGTTVLKDTSVEGNARNGKAWVGGTALNGLYGVSGMELNPVGYDLEAKKSYFMLDDEIVCLGTDITSDDSIETETIIESRKLSGQGDSAFSVDGIEKPTEADYNEIINNAKWAHLSGVNDGADIGYYFPDGEDINVIREERTGTWKNLRTDASSTPYTARWLTMWVNHGINPQAQDYSYVILPGKTSAQTKEYANNSPVRIVANDSKVQAVKDTNSGLLGANFWTDTKQSADILTVNKKASAMLKTTNGRLDFSISDPTQLQSDWIDVEIDKSAESVIFSDANIVVKQLAPTIKFAVNVDNANGKMFNISFDLDGSATSDAAYDTYIVDNRDDGFATDDTPWTGNNSTAGYYGTNVVTDNTSAADADRWARWTPSLVETDTYSVYIKWASISGAASAAPVQINYAGGSKTMQLNQTLNSGAWLWLGDYPFDEGTSGNVTLYATGSGKTVADAVKFVALNSKGNAAPDNVTFQEVLPEIAHEYAYETFDTGDFSVEDVYSESNVVKKILKVDSSPVMTGELSSASASFTTANPAYNETLLEKNDGSDQAHNSTQFFSTGAGKLTRASGGEDIRWYYNLPEKLTTENSTGKIVLEMRVRRPNVEYLHMVVGADTMTSYSQAGGKALTSVNIPRYGSTFTLNGASKINYTSVKNVEQMEWAYIRYVYYLNDEKVSIYVGETLENLIPLEGIGSDNCYDFKDTGVTGIGSIYFKGKGILAVDDIRVYSLVSDASLTISDAVCDDGYITEVKFTGDMPSANADTYIAQYYDDRLVHIKSFKDIQLAPVLQLQESVPVYTDCTVSIMVWKKGSLIPLCTSYEFTGEGLSLQDIIDNN